jgi:fibronectin type 3 domain-containing protein
METRVTPTADKLEAMTMRRPCAILVLFILTAALACHSKTPHSVTLTWREEKSPSGLPVAGYNIYRRLKGEERYAKIAGPVAHPPYEDRQVVSGHIYYYSVTAVDTTGSESRLSEGIRAAIP